MCGIAGGFGLNVSELTQTIPQMLNSIRHRGPDANGIWSDENSGVVLGHVRLAILDPSEAGAQPMLSKSGRYVIVFNGEIYNHLELRVALQKSFGRINWRGHSDTETLLAGIEYWGLRETLERCVGMFALAVWDTQKHVLQLARDRLGEKPLYYCYLDGGFAFGSELKALREFSFVPSVVDRDALALLLKHGYIPAPHSIYTGVSKLPPGQIMTLRLVQGKVLAPEFKSYWSFDQIRVEADANLFNGSDAQAVDALDEVIKSSVRAQMLSDVPLGVFLSGGVDSTSIVAMMQSVSSRPVKTFSIGFKEAGYSELKNARAVAEHLSTDHTELVVTSADALAVIPQLPHIYDEPFADASQIPTYLLCQLAKTQVTVSLSGDGGDELFCGYNRYIWGARVWPKVFWLPLAVRRAIAGAVLKVSATKWDAILSLANYVIPKRQRFKTMGNKLHRLATALGASSDLMFYEALTSKWLNSEAVVLGAAPETRSQDTGDCSTADMMAMDTVSYLPDDILVKVDRAAMACSLETRVPLLDHRVFEFAWRLPMQMKLRNGDGKWLLKQVLDRYVPRSLMARPKMGFDVPLDSWLRGPLRAWAETLLSAERLEREGYFDVQQVRTKWEEHLSGRCNWQGQLWCVLMFQAWLEKNPA